MPARTTAQEVAALAATVNAWREEDKRDRQEAKEQRESMAGDIDSIKADAAETRAHLAGLERDVKDAKSVTDQVKGWRAIATGIAIGFGVLGATFLFFKDHVASFIRHVISGA